MIIIEILQDYHHHKDLTNRYDTGIVSPTNSQLTGENNERKRSRTL